MRAEWFGISRSILEVRADPKIRGSGVSLAHFSTLSRQSCPRATHVPGGDARSDQPKTLEYLHIC